MSIISARPLQHPSHKRRILKTVTRICETKHVSYKLKHLKEVFQANGHSSAEIKRRIVNTTQRTKHFSDYASFPYLRKITERIGRLPTRYNVETSFKITQIRNMFGSEEYLRIPFLNHVYTDFLADVARYMLAIQNGV